MTVGKAGFSRPTSDFRARRGEMWAHVGSTFLPRLFPIINVRPYAPAKRTEGTNARVGEEG